MFSQTTLLSIVNSKHRNLCESKKENATSRASADIGASCHAERSEASWKEILRFARNDAALKEDFASVDGRDVLQRLSNIPIATWRRRAEDTDVRHIGLTAQYLAAAFGLGSSDNAISTVDADGVALTAIQSLHEILVERESETAHLKERIRARENDKSMQSKQITDIECPVKKLLTVQPPPLSF